MIDVVLVYAVFVAFCSLLLLISLFSHPERYEYYPN